MAKPARLKNQRFANAAPIPIEPALEPMPTISPQVRKNCQGAVMKTESPVPAIRTSMQPSVVRFTPMISTSPVMNGAVAPNRMMLIETAAEMVLTSQPKARCKGMIITPGAERTPTTASVAAHTRANATQA